MDLSNAVRSMCGEKLILPSVVNLNLFLIKAGVQSIKPESGQSPSSTYACLFFSLP